MDDIGNHQGYAFDAIENNGIRASFTLEPCDSILLFLDKTVVPAEQPQTVDGEAEAIALSEIEVKRLDDNNLILDYLDVAAGKKSESGVYWKKAAEVSFQENGLRGNIWDHCVQFRDELLQTEFEAESGFIARYNFTIEEAVPDTLYAVVERADLYTITCNDTPVAAEADAWWLDRAFGKIDIAKAAKVGLNELVITALPMTIFHELEAAHIIGDFSLKAARGCPCMDIALPILLRQPWTKWTDSTRLNYPHGKGLLLLCWSTVRMQAASTASPWNAILPNCCKKAKTPLKSWCTVRCATPLARTTAMPDSALPIPVPGIRRPKKNSPPAPPTSPCPTACSYPLNCCIIKNKPISQAELPYVSWLYRRCAAG